MNPMASCGTPTRHEHHPARPPTVADERVELQMITSAAITQAIPVTSQPSHQEAAEREPAVRRT